MTHFARPAAITLCLLLAACGGDGSGDGTQPAAGASAGAPARNQTEVARLLDCARVEGVTLISAHRGGPGPGRPENSLAAIRHAAQAGAAFAEIDLARTAEGAIVLMHDDTLERTTTGTGTVADTYLGDLRRYRLVDPDGNETGEIVPTLDEAFALALEAGIFLQLDLKDVAPEDAARIASDVGQAGRSLIIAYTVEDGRAARNAVAGIGLSLGVEDPATLEATGIGTDGLFAWLGGGVPSAALDDRFADIGVETGAHAFREEETGQTDYAAWRAAGVEVLAVDDVIAATGALGAVRTHCPEIFE
ncbi:MULTISPECIES: glycerophosphodiester phosphodiesterase family protein [Hyphobacterium]|uniref:Glycerophosphodiester phosphodiesterase family protein n=1 Tax=Hyphobacterium vulgare TaxID=1736751 RepID=A0ABV6ZXL6_9PROT